MKPLACLVVCGFSLIVTLSAVRSDDRPKPAEATADSEPRKELFSGKVLQAGDALKRKGLRPAEEMNSQIVLETEAGELIPILADWRGRAFYQDERLRNRRVDLVGYRRPGIPYLQILMVFTFNEAGEREYTDYWCDVCAIPMYEIKACECCQGEIRLRFQKQKLPEYLTEPDSKSSDTRR